MASAPPARILVRLRPIKPRPDRSRPRKASSLPLKVPSLQKWLDLCG